VEAGDRRCMLCPAPSDRFHRASVAHHSTRPGSACIRNVPPGHARLRERLLSHFTCCQVRAGSAAGRAAHLVVPLVRAIVSFLDARFAIDGCEQHRTVLRFQNVAWRFNARLIGSPSDPLDAGYLSVRAEQEADGQRRQVAGRTRAAMVRWPPGKAL